MYLKRLLLVGVVGLAFASSAISQTVVQTSVSGNEVWVAAQGPGGPGNYIRIDTVRDGSRLVLKSGTGADTSTATGGTLMWISTAPTTWAVTLPADAVAFAGEIVRLTTDTTLTSMVTVTAGAGSTLHATYASQTLTALTPVVFQYFASTKVWYRTQ